MRAQGNTHIEKLISISSEPLAGTPEPSKRLEAFTLGSELLRMLEARNGFYAFEAALHVFPLTSNPTSGFTLEEWNSESLWRADYQGLADGLLFFAEDVFQDQFCLSPKGVARFHAETGEQVFFAESIEKWADLILANYQSESGWEFANAWQAENGPLPPGKRLMPKIPFFLGGKYSLDNLWAGDPVEGMRFKADVAMQTRNTPNGTAVKLIIGPKP